MGSIQAAFTRSIEFIAWGNFADPRVLGLWAASFALLAPFVATAWAAGALLCRSLAFRSDEEEFVLVGASGLAALVLAATALAALHLYNAWAAAVVAATLIGASAPALARAPGVLWAVARRAPLLTAFALLVSLHALLPPYHWDEVSYHLAYPQQWIAVGGLTVDPHLPYPLYTLGWQALLGFALMTGSTSVAHLLSWLAGVLAAWCIGLFLDRAQVRDSTMRVARAAFLATPVVLSVLSAAMVDVPIMCLLTVSVYALYARGDGEESSLRAILPAAVCGAALLMLKVTSVLYLPLLIGLAVARFPRRPAAAYVALVLAGGGFWYVRNLVLAGDPFTPLLANWFGRPALYWSAADLAGQAANLAGGISYRPLTLLLLPVRTLTSVENGPLRGAPLLGYALLLPFSLLCASWFARRRAVAVLVATWYVVLTWLGTTYHLRYAYWVPLGVVCGALMVDCVCTWWRKAPGWIEWAAPIFLLIGPTPAVFTYVKAMLHDRIPIGASARIAYAFGGAADTRAYSSVVEHAARGAGVYNVGPPLTYYWQDASLRVLDGAFHPGGLLEFESAVNRGDVPDFLHRVGADYLVLNGTYADQFFGRPEDSISARVARALGPPLYRDSVWVAYAIH